MNLLIAATESPPPIKENAPLAVASTMAFATATVPAWKFPISKTPIGPFQRISLEERMISAHAFAVLDERAFKSDEIVLFNCSGRGDKDLETYIDYFKL